MIRRIGINVGLKGRIVMFTDGKCTSTSVRQDVDDENYNPMESMESVRNMVALEVFCLLFKFFLIFLDYQNTGLIFCREKYFKIDSDI